jgi:hypothetical protein
MVIRPNNRVLSDYLKIFFESPVGVALIKSFQRETNIVNINHTDIMGNGNTPQRKHGNVLFASVYYLA